MWRCTTAGKDDAVFLFLVVEADLKCVYEVDEVDDAE